MTCQRGMSREKSLGLVCLKHSHSVCLCPVSFFDTANISRIPQLVRPRGSNPLLRIHIHAPPIFLPSHLADLALFQNPSDSAKADSHLTIPFERISPNNTAAIPCSPLQSIPQHPNFTSVCRPYTPTPTPTIPISNHAEGPPITQHTAPSATPRTSSTQTWKTSPDTS